MNRNWQRIRSGLLIPAGWSVSRTNTSSETYLDIKEKTFATEEIFKKAGVPIPRNCGLDKLIQNARLLSDEWLVGNKEKINNNLLFSAAHLLRVHDALEKIAPEDIEVGHLARLTNGSFELHLRNKSVSKNIFWEFELLMMLRKQAISARFLEPPDIVAEFEGDKLGIACKKLYSELNVEKVLSQGLAQIEKNYEYGIVALNLDDLLPANSMLRVQTEQDIGKRISDFNVQFLARHERHLRKYLGSGRMLAAFVSTGVLAHARDARGGLINARQSSNWVLQEHPGSKRRVFNAFFKALMR